MCTVAMFTLPKARMVMMAVPKHTGLRPIVRDASLTKVAGQWAMFLCVSVLGLAPLDGHSQPNLFLYFSGELQ